MNRDDWHPGAPISLKEAKAVAGIEPQMENYKEAVMAEAAKHQREAERKRKQEREEYYKERRARERNFERMVLG